MNATHQSSIRTRPDRRKSAIVIASVLVFSAIGIIALQTSNAATGVALLEAESGVTGGNASKLNTVAGAGGQSAVQFRAGAVAPPNPNPNPAPGGVPAISRDGVKLMRAGKQWKFAGVNGDGFNLNSCRVGPEWDEDDNMTDANIDKFFKELNPHSVTRIWPYKGAGNIPLMDKMVAAAEKYGQYLAPAFFDGNRNGSQCGSQKWGDVSANLNHIKPIIERYAKDTGSRKTNVIAFWETSNEIGGTENRSWHQAMAKGIKQMDPRTLVGTGTSPYNRINPTNPTADLAEIKSIHDSPEIDLISIHEYDGGCKVSHQADKAIGAAKALNKPWYSGESGGAGSGNCLKQEWQAYIDQNESAGMLYWDFKMTTQFGGDTMTFIGGSNDLWEAAKSFRHQFQGL